MTMELLSPAGDFEKCRTALHFGADAVYAGGPGLHLRKGASGFTLEALAKAVQYTHEQGKKFYVTLNAFARNGDLDALPDLATAYQAMGVDGAIVADLGVLSVCKKAAPRLPLHISTQANCVNYQTARMYHDLGASRVVLARELSLEEIAGIRAKTPAGLELEAFVHGAMCMSYSGRCFLSAYLTGRDANQGDCDQPCRWQYALMEQTRPGQYFPVEQDERGTYFLSSYDLCMIEHLDDLQKAGVSSLKIEGRMKSPYYVATVTHAYRQALDGAAPLSVLQRELDCVSHRAFSTGFYYGPMDTSQTAAEYLQSCQFSAVVLGRTEGRLLIEQRNKFSVGDTLEVVSPRYTKASFCVEALWDESGRPVESAPHAQQRLQLRCPYPLTALDILRRRL